MTKSGGSRSSSSSSSNITVVLSGLTDGARTIGGIGGSGGGLGGLGLVAAVGLVVYLAVELVRAVAAAAVQLASLAVVVAVLVIAWKVLRRRALIATPTAVIIHDNPAMVAGQPCGRCLPVIRMSTYRLDIPGIGVAYRCPDHLRAPAEKRTAIALPGGPQ